MLDGIGFERVDHFAVWDRDWRTLDVENLGVADWGTVVDHVAAIRYEATHTFLRMID